MTAKILVGIALLAMSEDVEIMRQIVERAVGDTYKNRAAAQTIDWLIVNDEYFVGPHGKASDATGVYLPGYGVLIQVTAPMPFQQAVSKVKVEVGGEIISQWEAARRKLRGESLAAQLIVSAFPDSTHTPTRDQLTRGVLDVLAENGHNFRELPASDRLAVDIVFRDRKAARCAECHEAGAASFGLQSSAGKRLVPAMGLQVTGPLANDMSHALQALQVKSADENAGDLHMRQKNYAKAIEAYEKVLKAAAGKTQDYKDLLALYKKLAQAHVGAGQYKDAERLLKMLADSVAKRENSPFWTWHGSQKGKPVKQPDSPAAALPAHLIISATKSQLDAVAEGKMSRDEFAKAAQIEYLDPLEASVEENSEKGKPSNPR